jgi:hypothetical protein
MASSAAVPKIRTNQVADDAYSEAVISALRQRLRQVSTATSEPLEAVLGPAEELAARVSAAVPSANSFAQAVGPVYRQAGLAKACGLTRQAINDWVRNRRVLSLTTADDVVLIPAFQFDRQLRPWKGIDQVLEILTPDVVDEWTLASWLTAPQPTLDGESMIDRIGAGDIASALSVAESARRRWIR